MDHTEPLEELFWPSESEMSGDNGSLTSGRSICGEEVGECWVGESDLKRNHVDFLHFCCPVGACAPHPAIGEKNCDLLSSPEQGAVERSDNWSEVKC